MLEEYIDFFNSKKYKYEVIVVDDGSKDKTYILYSTEIALEIGKKTKANLKVIQCLDNGGKGSAVKFGVLSCEGEYILFADADNATQVKSFNLLEEEIAKIQKRGLGVVVGSRHHLREDIVREVKYYIEK